METEYVVCSAITKDVVWLKGFHTTFRNYLNSIRIYDIFFDKSIALVVTKDPKYHGKIKHIKEIYHYIKDAITKEDVVLKHISTTWWLTHSPSQLLGIYMLDM